MVDLGEVALIISGQSPEGQYYNEESKGLPFYQGKADFGDLYVKNPTKWTTQVTKEAIRNDILMSVRAPVGPVNLAPFTLCIGRGLAAIRPNTDLLNQMFLLYLLRSAQEEIKKYSNGSTFESINREQIGTIKIPLPSLEIQQEIVVELDSYQKVIDGARLVVSNYKPTIKIDPHWEIVELGRIIDIITDYHANGSYEILKEHVDLKDKEDFALMIRSTDFENGFRNDLKYIDKRAYEFLSKSKLFGGELIINKIGNAGKVYLMPYFERPCSLAMNQFMIRINENYGSNQFVYYFLNSPDGQTQIQDRLHGATTKTITKDEVRSIMISLPPLDIQKQIVSQLEQEQKLVDANKKLIEIFEQKIKDKIAEVWGELEDSEAEVKMPPQFGTFKQVQRVQQSDAEQLELGLA